MSAMPKFRTVGDYIRDAALEGHHAAYIFDQLKRVCEGHRGGEIGDYAAVFASQCDSSTILWKDEEFAAWMDLSLELFHDHATVLRMIQANERRTEPLMARVVCTNRLEG